MHAPIIKLHPEEQFFPMDPLLFIQDSRFRHHRGFSLIDAGIDEGFNTETKTWDENNSKDPKYFNAPVDFVNSLTLHSDGRNRRPRDSNAGDDLNVFLQPEGKPTGHSTPTNNVPVFLSESANGSHRFLQFWIFFGFNGSLLSHQGDWEDITIKVNGDGQVEGAFLSAHGKRPFFPQSELIIENDRVVVFCSRETHAFYPAPGTHGSLDQDKTAAGGFSWDTAGKVEDLSVQPWRDYAGAWGEVGDIVHTTGPLGPWFKRFDLES